MCYLEFIFIKVERSAICGWLLTGYEGFWKKTKDDDSKVGREEPGR